LVSDNHNSFLTERDLILFNGGEVVLVVEDSGFASEGGAFFTRDIPHSAGYKDALIFILVPASVSDFETLT
jgi:hypothetical protein